MKKIYLATPYSTNADSVLRIARFEAVNIVAAKLMSEGNLVFSPISHTHPIVLAGDLPTGWEFWKEYDRSFIEWADEVHVFKQDGWQISTGVTAEIKIANEMGKSVQYIANHQKRY